jgi:outer membrane lipoprotein-sorting protein
MPESSRSTSVGQAELGALLVLLHGADAAFRSVEATWRLWRHEERLRQAFVADAEEQKRRGASISSRRIGNGAPEPPENEEMVRIWREGERFREEHHGGRRDGYYAVADGQVWWMWDERMGARSNQDDPSVGSGVGQELEVMLNPTPLLSSLRFRVTGSSDVAGRPAVTAHAWPRPQDLRYGRSLELHQIGTGAHDYELEIDQERGVLLAATAIRDGQPFHTITALTIRFDEPIPDETFQFKPPEGEEIQTTGNRHRLQHITLTEAQQRAPFTVLMPNRVPAGWQVRCTFIGASQRPPSPAQVGLGYRSGDGHESVSISQMATADRASHHYENMVNNEDWQEMTYDGTTVKVRPADWGQAQAHLERNGTFAFLVSDNLTNNQLGTIAAGLRPARSTGSI